MELEVSLLCLQEPTTSSYPESPESSPRFQTYVTKIHSNTILHLRLGLPSDFFPSSSPTKIPCTFIIFPIRATCPANFILLDLITLI
jgi:hypothetical protein